MAGGYVREQRSWNIHDPPTYLALFSPISLLYVTCTFSPLPFYFLVDNRVFFEISDYGQQSELFATRQTKNQQSAYALFVPTTQDP